MEHKQYKFLLVKLLVALAFISNTTYAEDWKRVKKSNDIQVYTAQQEGSKIKKMKAILEVDIPFEVAVEIIKDPQSSKEWYGMCGGAEVISTRDSYRDYDMYFILDVPVITDRDVVARAKSFIDYSEQKAWVKVENIESNYKKDSGLVRMAKLHSSYSIKRQSNKTVIIYQVFADIGGSLPAWILNSASLDHPLETLEGLKQQGLKEKYWQKASQVHGKDFMSQYRKIIAK